MALTTAIARARGGIEEELWVLERWGDRSRNAVDIGANEGIYSFLMSHWFKRVYAFEPNRSITAALSNCASPRLALHNVGLSSGSGKATLHIPVSDSGVEMAGWGSLYAETLPSHAQMQETEVQLEALDAFGFEQVAVIKIDVEGHELEVLRGAVNTIEHNRPVMMIEVKQHARTSVGEFLNSLGYKQYIWSDNILTFLQNGVINYTGPKENIFALPESPTTGL